MVEYHGQRVATKYAQNGESVEVKYSYAILFVGTSDLLLW